MLLSDYPVYATQITARCTNNGTENRRRKKGEKSKEKEGKKIEKKKKEKLEKKKKKE